MTNGPATENRVLLATNLSFRNFASGAEPVVKSINSLFNVLTTHLSIFTFFHKR